MDSPSLGPETPLEADDMVYPCKGCGEILEEGKAFELAGNRWHIDCFRCNTCGTLLDSDANLLLLGDGSLICNNCTYSCSACGNKIEDLAILTGDQAFCAACFKCRNCKKKIENLRYARTSQGVFCMTCHESLMARRRKKNRMAAARTASDNSSGKEGPAVLDKSLPALPSTVVPQALLSKDAQEKTDPVAIIAAEEQKENLSQNPDVYGHERHSPDVTHPGVRDGANPDDGLVVPVAFDPTTSRDPSPLSRSRLANSIPPDITTGPGVREAFGDSKGLSSVFKDDFGDLVAGSSRSASSDRKGRARYSPHIAFQEKGKQDVTDVSEALRKRKEAGGLDAGSSGTSPINGSYTGSRLSLSHEHGDSTQAGDFKLQEVPKRRRSSGSKGGSKESSNGTTPKLASSGGEFGQAVAVNGWKSPFPPSHTAPPVPEHKNPLRRSAVETAAAAITQQDSRTRDHSLQKSAPKPQVARKEVPSLNSDQSDPLQKFHQRNHSGSSPLSRQQSVKLKGISKPIDSISSNNNITDGPPPRSLNRPGTISESKEKEFTAPRHAPPPPPTQRHQQNNSLSSIQSEHFHTREQPGSPLPIYSTFLDEAPNEDDLSHASAKGEEVEGPGLFRRVSKAVKHGRSHSDKIGAASPKWGKNTRNGFMEISSPIITSPDFTEDVTQLRNKLRFAQQRIAELETEKMALHEKVHGAADIRQVNTELREKRSTMAFLDTQREMVMRELEVMTDYLAKTKESKEPLNVENLKLETMKDFGNSLLKLKEQLGGKIEELTKQKMELTNDIANLIQMKDKGYQEYESLSTKNHQLVELNNQLVRNIQDLYKQGRQPNTPGFTTHANGLGIYPNHNIEKTDFSAELNSVLSVDTSHLSRLSGDTETEPATVLTEQPHVVEVRKGGQPRKFNWIKGGHAVAKNVSKGFKGAFSTQTAILRDELEGVPYGQNQACEAPVSVATISKIGADQKVPSWGFLNAQNPKAVLGKPGSRGETGINNAEGLPAESTVFGADLTARCDFEKRVIPSLVSACVEEVELRGMIQEGVYRKSGSSSQVKMLQAGFERAGADKDFANPEISHPDTDIHAVTSVLKQYFRRLPTPLVTYESYDSFLEAAQHEDDAERAKELRAVVDGLPRCHRDCLEFLVAHLVRVMEKQEFNLMTPLNLAVVFAPTIMRPEAIEREVTDMQSQRVAVQSLLEMHDVIFSGHGSD